MLGLKSKCLHPATREPYIRSSTGGLNNSPEGASVRPPPRRDAFAPLLALGAREQQVAVADISQKGLTHAFVVEFENEEDRAYYLEKDPAHLSFVESVKPMLKDIQVVDYTPGVY